MYGPAWLVAWPCALPPQHLTLPSFMSAQVWYMPALTCTGIRACAYAAGADSRTAISAAGPRAKVNDPFFDVIQSSFPIGSRSWRQPLRTSDRLDAQHS